MWELMEVSARRISNGRSFIPFFLRKKLSFARYFWFSYHYSQRGTFDFCPLSILAFERLYFFFLSVDITGAHTLCLIFPALVHRSGFSAGLVCTAKTGGASSTSSLTQAQWRRKNVEPAWHRSPSIRDISSPLSSAAALERRLAPPEFMIFESARNCRLLGKKKSLSRGNG